MEVIKMVKDLVCGMQVDESKAKAKAVYQGKTYYFCSHSCQEKFLSSPDKFIEKEKQSQKEKD
jgi:YHS domain-containing protein